MGDTDRLNGGSWTTGSKHIISSPNYVDPETPQPDDVRPWRFIALVDFLCPALLLRSRRSRPEARTSGMSALHAQPLRIVEKRQGNTASAPADLERMSGPSMSGHLKCLESAGWITRDAAVMRDRRCARLPLTATGLAAQNATRQRRHDWFRRADRGLEH